MHKPPMGAVPVPKGGGGSCGIPSPGGAGSGDHHAERCPAQCERRQERAHHNGVFAGAANAVRRDLGNKLPAHNRDAKAVVAA